MKQDPRDAVFMNLPYTYRRVGQGTPMHLVARALGALTSQLERDARGVLTAHSVVATEDLGDLERLAALYGLTPWQQEDAEAFRYRLLTTARVRLQGAATAKGILEMVGAAHNAELVTWVLPGHAVPEEARTPTTQFTDAYTTLGFFRQRKSPFEPFLAKVVDMPPKAQGNPVRLTGIDFEINVGSYAEADAGQSLSGPTFTLTAGQNGLNLPVLLNLDTGNLALINRLLPAGETLQVDLDAGTAEGGSIGPILVDGVAAPPVLYGSGAFLDREGEVTAAVLGRGRLLQWQPVTYRGWDLKPGLTRWRLMRAVGPDGKKPASPVALEAIRLMPVSLSWVPAEMAVGWMGRRPGTFTMAFLQLNRPGAQWERQLQGEVLRVRPNAATGDFVIANEVHAAGNQERQPVIEIVAGARPVVLPVLYQRSVQRLLLINREIPPGGSIQVDLEEASVQDLSDTPSRPAALLMGGNQAPPLLYGAVAAGLDDGAMILDDPGGAGLVYWARAVNPVPFVPPMTGNGEMPATLPWPPLFPPGDSSWRLMSGVTQSGAPPQSDAPVELTQLRVVPCQAQNAPGELRIRWQGQSNAPHQWLMEQVQALKLAGVMYV